MKILKVFDSQSNVLQSQFDIGNLSTQEATCTGIELRV